MSRVAVVTGGASGIGFGIAERLLAAGHRVAILDHRADAVTEATEQLGVVGHVVDVCDRAGVDHAMTAIREELGPIGIVVTSAGITAADRFTDIAVDDWERVIAINLTGTFHSIQSVVPDMLEAGWGRIVTISSTAGQAGAPKQAHYVASKGGVIALTKALALELAAHGITANTIPPSIIDTPMARQGELDGEVPAGGLEALAAMTPVRRLGRPEDVAAACAFLCSEDAGYITGQQINVNGGWYL
jgi:2-hydroxycyclohexanecarboxyl-CoA dehydrogenase